MIKRKLSIRFQKSIGNTTQRPDVAEVVIVPLSSPSSSQDNVTLAGGRQIIRKTLSDLVNVVEFELIPSSSPGLSEEIWYRIAWRTQYLGSVTTYDFKMPDFDCDFDDLEELDAIIDGQTYLQQLDLGVAGRVAKLDDDGDVTNSFGVKITGTGDAVAVDNRLSNEIVNRQQADNAVRIALEQELAAQIQATLTTTRADLLVAVGILETADLVEKTARINAVEALNTAVDTLEGELNDQISDLVTLTQSHASLLLTKADLVGGKIPTSQLPSITLTTAFPVDDEDAMLALDDEEVDPGDLAVRPDGSWILLQNPTSDIENWLKVSTGGEVLSVNGQTGVVVLSASDVGARSSSSPVPFEDVTGLTAFQTSTNNSLTTQGNRVTAIEEDVLIVRLNEDNVIESELLSNEVAFVNGEGVLVTKAGDPIVVVGSGNVDSVNGHTGVVVLDAADVGARPVGGSVPAGDITGLDTVLEGYVTDDDTRLTDSRSPTPHKLTHAVGGSDVLTPANIGARAVADPVPLADVVGLTGTLTNHGNRINALESGGGGGGGGGADVKAIRWDYFGTTDDFDEVAVDSPFGYNPANPDANDDGFYYDPEGAADGEGAYAHVHRSGYLEVRRRIVGATPDAPTATQDDLDALITVVGGKASTTALNDLITVVGGKASQADLTSLTSTVDLKANQSTVDTLTTTVGTKANQSTVDTLTTTVGTKANQSALDTTNSTVATKANQSDLTTATGRITTVENTLPNKADLTAGKVPLAQIPTNIPEGSVVGLTAKLATKADLVGGKLSTSQLPAISTHETYTAANKAAMLALTTSQVQVGDVCWITATADKGGYTLIGADPAVFGNWLKHTYPDDAVVSVNGSTGVVVLSATDVGARSSVVSVPMADVSGLGAALDLKANLTALATKTSPTDVNNQISAATLIKQVVNRVATVNVASLSGTQVVDGSLVPIGQVVLLTAQTSSIQNGIWTVNSSAWSRVSDMNETSYFVRGTLVFVSGGATNSDTIWIETATSGIVGTNNNNWSLAMRAGPPIEYTGGNGITVVDDEIAVSPTSGGGIVATVSGVSVDPNLVVRKYAVNLPGGSNPAPVTHGLNSLDVQVTIRDIASGQIVLAPVVVTGVNTISIDFNSTPAANQYRVVVQA